MEILAKQHWGSFLWDTMYKLVGLFALTNPGSEWDAEFHRFKNTVIVLGCLGPIASPVTKDTKRV